MDILQRLQHDVRDLLNTAVAGTKLAHYQHIPVHVMRPRVNADGDLEDAVMISTAIDQALAGLTEKNGKNGMAAIVMMPDVGVPAELQRVRGPMVQISLTVRLIEDPLVNMSPTGTRVSVEEVAKDTLAVLHGWNPGRMQHELRARERGAMVEIGLKDKPNCVCWDVQLVSQYHIQPSPAADAPEIALAGELPALTVTLTAPDVGAQIFYTLDGSLPFAGSAAASLYEAPFLVSAAATVRTAAYLTNHLPSNVTEVDIA
jgi:hypothetical protein